MTRLPTGLILALALIACSSGEDPAQIDTGFAPIPGVPALTADTPVLPRPDSSFTRAGAVINDTLTSIGTPEIAAPAAAASKAGGEPVATAAELADLRSRLVVPVRGFARADVPDNFDEMRGTRRHDALDFLAPRGTPVISAVRGRVLRKFSSENGGLMVYAADETERFILMYAHLDGYAPGLEEGMMLERGQVLGYVGTTGNAPPTVPHLHFAVVRAGKITDWWKGTPVDPRPLLIP